MEVINTIRLTRAFEKWLEKLKDFRAISRITARIESARRGNFGDCKPVGRGVSEMRVFVGKGYRLYFIQNGDTVYILLNGGDKSTQQQDIKKAKKIAKELGILS